MRTKFFLQKKPNRKRNGLHEWQIRAFCTNGVFLQEIPITNVNINVTIPDSVTKIGYSAFNCCASLTSVTFKDTNNWYYTSKSNYTGGTVVDMTDSGTNATKLKDTYCSYYWYKAEQFLT